MSLYSLKNKKITRVIAVVMQLLLISQLTTPLLASSNRVTGDGSFTGSGGSGNLVNLKNGSLNYELPVITVPGPNGGYPVNLSYSSAGVSMMSESSWVGLGWSLGAGSVNRSLQGVPDDFDGENDYVSTKVDMSSNVVTRINFNINQDDVEAFGIPIPDKDLNKKGTFAGALFYDNQRGLGFELSYQISRPKKVEGEPSKYGFTGNFAYNSFNGYSTSFSGNAGKSLKANAGISASSRGSLGYSISTSYSLGLKGENKLEKDKTLKDKFKDKATFSASANAGLTTLARPAGVPSSINMKNLIIDTGLKLDFESSDKGYIRKGDKFFTKLLWSNIFISASSPEFNGETEEKPAYGYMNYEYGDDGIVDFSGKSFPNEDGSRYLSASKPNYDVFYVSGAGTGGAFRVKKTSVEIYSPTTSKTITKKHRPSADFGPKAGQYFALGYGFNFKNNYDRRGSWLETEAYDEINFESNSRRDWFLTSHGTTEDATNNVLSLFGGEEAMAPVIAGGNGKVQTHMKRRVANLNGNLLGYKNSVSKSSIQGLALNEKRNKTYQFILHGERADIGSIEKDYLIFEDQHKTRSNGVRQSNHISEVNVFEIGGQKYSYGLPVYTLVKKDVSYSVLSENKFEETFNSKCEKNESGSDKIDGYYKRIEKNVSPFPSSWLLTQITSNDYVDIDDNGLTDNDYGYWVKFQYDYIDQLELNSFPFTDAYYNEGLRGKNKDNEGSYSEEEKENYYLNRIETSTHYAVFETGDREDKTNAKYLKKIKLYAKDKSGKGGEGVLLKTAHFEYDYSMCPDYEQNVNEGLGKLTLKRVYFTMYSTDKSAENVYEFGYEDDNSQSIDNPSFNALNTDRWGDFKANVNLQGEFISTSDIYRKGYPFTDFAYTDNEENITTYFDNEGKVTSYAPNRPNHYVAPAPWCLKSIKTPLGSSINIDYEKNRYSYVENKPVLEMYDIVGVLDDKGVEDLKDGSIHVIHKCLAGKYVTEKYGNYVYSPLKKKSDNVVMRLPDGTTDQEFKDKILGNLDKVFIQAYVQLGGLYDNEEKWHMIKLMEGFTVPDQAVYTIGNDTYGLIKLNKPYKNSDKKLSKHNPFRKAGVEALLRERTDIAYGGDGVNGDPAQANIFEWIDDNLFPIVTDLFSVLSGNQYQAMYNKGMVKNIRLSGWSKIRLRPLSQEKLGGGYRVKSISISDNWVNDPNDGIDDSYEYVQDYDYTTTWSEEFVASNARADWISSGVSYEPLKNGEESANYFLNYYFTKDRVGERRSYMEMPVWDHLYPGAGIQYARVKTSNKYQTVAKTTGENISFNNSSTPVTINEYYTAKDFPVFVQHKSASDYLFQTNILIPLPYYNETDKDMLRSEGHSIVKNDMSGKPFRVSQVVRGKLISQQTYNYRSTKHAVDYTDQDGFKDLGNTVNIVSNEGDVITKNGTDFSLNKSKIGFSYDIFLELTENRSIMQGVEDFELNFPIPKECIFCIVPDLSFANHNNTFRQAILTKIIERHGLLESVDVLKNQNTIKSEYLAYDAETAQPILTRVNDEFGRYIYNMQMPAYWSYKDMGLASDNTDEVFTSSSDITQVNDLYTGDIVSLQTTNGHKIASVLESNGVQLYYDKDNVIIPREEITKVRVINSRKNNQQFANGGSLSFMSFKQFTLRKEFNELNTSYPFTPDEILNISVMTYKGNWDTGCELDELKKGRYNPWLYGEQGVWRPFQSYIFNGDRYYLSHTPGNSPQQKEGTIISGTDWSFEWNNENYYSEYWKRTNMIHRVDINGHVIEVQDANNKFSSSLYGYENEFLLEATSVLSEKRQMYFDSFEELRSRTSSSSTYYPFQGAQVTSDYSHSGKYSIKVKSNSQASAMEGLGRCDEVPQGDGVKDGNNQDNSDNSTN